MKTLEQRELEETENLSDEEKINEHKAIIESEIAALDKRGIHATITYHQKINNKLIVNLIDKMLEDNLGHGIHPDEDTKNKQRFKKLKHENNKI